MSEEPDIRQLLMEKLDTAFQAAGHHPIIVKTTWPVTPAGNDNLEKEAKGRGDNGIVFIGRDVRVYGERKGYVYNTQDPYLILIYTNAREDDTLIHSLYETARRCLFNIQQIRLHSDYIMDVNGYKSGLYLAWIRCSYWPALYHGQ